MITFLEVKLLNNELKGIKTGWKMMTLDTVGHIRMNYE